jgi:PhnB protein
MSVNQRKELTMQIDAYLFFPGCAEEAMEFYRSVFGGTLTVVRRGEVDQAAPADEKDLVINASLDSGDFQLRASDRDGTSKSEERVALTLIGTDESRLRKIYDDLSAGGSQDAALEKQFWGDIFGALTDKFGISWQVNIGSTAA